MLYSTQFLNNNSPSFFRKKQREFRSNREKLQRSVDDRLDSNQISLSSLFPHNRFNFPIRMHRYFQLGAIGFAYDEIPQCPVNFWSLLFYDRLRIPSGFNGNISNNSNGGVCGFQQHQSSCKSKRVRSKGQSPRLL